MSEKPPAPKTRPLNWGREANIGTSPLIQPKGLKNVIRRGSVEKTDSEKSEWASGPTRDAAKKENRFTVLSTILIAAIFLFALLAGGWHLVRKKPQVKTLIEDSVAVSNSAIDDLSHIQVPETNLYKIPPITVAKRFAGTSDIEERLKWTRNPEVIQTRVEDYPEEARTTASDQVSELNYINAEGLEYLSYLVKLPNGSRRFLCVVSTDNGPRVDWDAYARFGTETWNTILQGKCKTATVRVLPVSSSYYNGRYSDSNRWSAYTLRSPDLEAPLYGYIAKDSELDKHFNSGLRGGARRAILEIEISPTDIALRQVDITNVKAFGWLEK